MNVASIALGVEPGDGNRAILRVVSEFQSETDRFASSNFLSNLKPFDGTQSATILTTSVVGRLGYELIYLNRAQSRFVAPEGLFTRIALLCRRP